MPKGRVFARCLAASVLAGAASFALITSGMRPIAMAQQAQALLPVPDSSGPIRFAVDPSWPRELPNFWILAQVGGMYVDGSNHIWVLQRPGTNTADEVWATTHTAICCFPAPPVLEFDINGNLLQAWGGPGSAPNWPLSEHGIFVDSKGFVWIGGNGATDRMILKFRQNGSFVMQIGTPGAVDSNLDTVNLGKPADIYVDYSVNTPNGEVFVADGYGNNRIAVFDATTGKFITAWGAYGTPYTALPAQIVTPPYVNFPVPQPPSKNFGNPVHCITGSRGASALLYVCDRVNDRYQVFTKTGTFKGEFFYATTTGGPGSVWDLRFWPRGTTKYLIQDDGTNQVLRVTNPVNGAVVSQLGHNGRNAGFFHWVHKFGVDSAGDLYTGEVDTGKRLQRLVPVH